MKLGFQPPNSWEDFNDEAAGKLGIKEKGMALRTYVGLAQALNELAQGLCRQFPHRKKVFYIRGLDPAFENHMVHLSREGVNVQALDGEVLKDPASFLAQVDAETLFVLYAEDDPLFGRLYEIQAFETALKDKKIFRLRVSHAHHQYLPLPTLVDRHDLRIWELNPRLSLVLFNDRLKWNSITAGATKFGDDELTEILRLKTQKFLNPGAVEKFESLSLGGAAPVLAGQARIPDRAVVHWEDMDGWAVINRLAQKLNIKLPAAGENSPLETTSLHRWGGVKTMDWLRGFGFTDAMIRGTVIIDHAMLTNDFIRALEETRAEILSLQSGM